MREAYKVLRIYADESAARTVDIGDEQEGDREDKRQDEKKYPFYLGVLKIVAEQDIAEDSDL